MEIAEKEVARYLRLGGREPDAALAARIAALRASSLKEIQPARVWRRVGWPMAEGAFASSKSLARHLANCQAAYLVCGTIGPRFDALLRRASVTSAADALVLQAIGAAAIEEWMDAVEDEIRQELADGESLVTRYSPGYGDLPLEAQRELFALLDAPRSIGVSLTDSLLMVPSKSVSAIIGVKRETPA